MANRKYSDELKKQGVEEYLAGARMTEEELKLYKRLTVAQTKKVVTPFIDYYNTSRPQGGLKKMTPAEYRNHPN